MPTQNEDRYTIDSDEFEEDVFPSWQLDFKQYTRITEFDTSRLSKDLPKYWINLISKSNHLKRFARPLNEEELRQTVVPIECGEFCYSEPQSMSDDVFGFGTIVIESELLMQDLAYFELEFEG